MSKKVVTQGASFSQALGMNVTMVVVTTVTGAVAAHLAQRVVTKLHERQNQPEFKFGFEGKL